MSLLEIPNYNTQTLDTSAPLQAVQEAESNGLQMIKQRFDNANEREKSHVRSMAVNAIELQAYKDNPEAARAHLIERIKNLDSRAAKGQDIHSNDSRELLQMLDTDPNAFWQTVSAHEKLGYVAGAITPITGNSNTFGSEAISALMKENPNMSYQDALFQYQTGNRQLMTMQDGSLSPMAGAAGAKKDLSKADKAGELDATNDLDNQKKAVRGTDILQQISMARKLLPNATGSGAGNVRDAVKGFVGYSDDKTQANSSLATISGWMTANVPRMEGPQSNFDVDNYKVMAAKVGDSSQPINDRLAALNVVEGLFNKYAPLNGDNSDNPNNPPPLPNPNLPPVFQDAVPAQSGVKFLGFEGQ